MVYILLLFLLLIGVYVYDIKHLCKNRLPFFYFILLLFSFTSGLSYRLGTDIIGYSAEYELYWSLSDVNTWSYFISFQDRMPLWVFLLSLFRTLGLPFAAFHLFQALMINFSIGYIVRKYSNAWFSIILLYYVTLFTLFNYEIMRESLAISVFFFSIPYLLRSQYFKFYICALIALGFHLSSSILLLVPLIKLIPQNKYGVVIGIIISFSILLFANIFTSNLLLILNVDLFQDKAISYFSNERYATSKFSVSLLANIGFFVILPYVIFLRYLKNQVEKTVIVFRFVVVFTVIYCCTIVVPIFYRINNYFTIFFLIYLGDLLSLRKGCDCLSYKRGYNWASVLVILFVILKINVFFTSLIGDTSFPSYKRYYPYSSVFTKEVDRDRENIYYKMTFE